MNNKKLASLQDFAQNKVTSEQLVEILATESSYSQQELGKLVALAQYQLEQQQGLGKIILQIREHLNLDDIFRTTTKEVCQLLEADRVAVYRFTPEWGGEFVAEFVTPGWVRLVGPEIKKIWTDTNLQETQGGRYRYKETLAVDDIYTVGHRQCHLELLEQFQARAYMIVPVLLKDRLWGLLTAYQNSGPRCWQPTEVNLLAQIGIQFGVAVLQAELLAEMQAEVDERQRIEVALRLAEHKYRTIFENAVEGIFQTTPDGRCLNANPALAEILGYASPEELMANLTDLRCQVYVDTERRVEFVHLVQQHGLVSKFESQAYCKDGRMIWISENAQAVYDSSGVLLYYEGFVEDITKQKQAEADIRNALEKEKELSELKSIFVTTASHEFRTPLAAILSSTELLRKYSHKLGEEQKLTQLQQIQITVSHMTHLLNDVLLLGKAEAGKLAGNSVPLDLVQFCHAVVVEMQLTSDSHIIAFSSQGNNVDTCMDQKLLMHILSNLLSNAIKYSPQGGKVYFDLAYEPAEVIFQIQDEGIGIPLADQARLFESFQRASNVGAIAGKGLGLAIVKKSVDQHGGTISVNSEVGVGTRFTVRIPFPQQVSVDDQDSSN